MRWKIHIVNNICDRGGKQTKRNAFSKIIIDIYIHTHDLDKSMKRGTNLVVGGKKMYMKIKRKLKKWTQNIHISAKQLCFYAR